MFYGLLWLIGRATASIRLTGVGWQALSGNFYVTAAAVLACVSLARLQRQPFSSFGLGGPRKASYFIRGLVAGFTLLSVLLLLLRLFSNFRFGRVTAGVAPLLQSGLLYATGMFMAVAFAEENLWRGYALVNLSQSISFWPAAILLGMIFGATHLNHATENILAVIASVFGVVLAWSFRRLGSLWFALGAHAGWDYAESYVYGVPDSGVVLPGALLHPAIAGPDWLTGGHAGPEGSVFMVVIFALLVYFIRLQSDARRQVVDVKRNRAFDCAQLFVPQCGDRIDRRCAASRQQTSDGRNPRQEHHNAQQNKRVSRVPSFQLAITFPNAILNRPPAQQTAHHGDSGRCEYEPQHVMASCAQRHADAEFVGPLHHDVGHHAIKS